MANTRKSQSTTFQNREIYLPKNEREIRLIRALVLLKTEKDAAALLRDMLTPAEIEEFSNRLEIAKLLVEGFPYLEIAKQVGTSTTTVTRVAYWLFNGCGGYQAVLKKLKK